MLAITLCLSKDQAGFEPMITALPAPALARSALPSVYAKTVIGSGMRFEQLYGRPHGGIMHVLKFS